MKYPVKILKLANESHYTFEVVDIVGCVLKESSVDVGLNKLNNVIADHLAILAEYGETIPHASDLDQILQINAQALTTSTQVIWAIVDFDIIPYLGKSHKINVTLPELLIKKIDACVSKSSDHKTRSGFIAAACVNELSR